jgi:hypothetical protein
VVELREHVMRQPDEPIAFVSRFLSKPTSSGSIAAMASNAVGVIEIRTIPAI